ncbi:MAG: hypothetical protein P4M13_03585 [Alphaproteobacteria bacterium]|nr:hypothetical protein [Alphaproteobacteria bacterium]
MKNIHSPLRIALIAAVALLGTAALNPAHADEGRWHDRGRGQRYGEMRHEQDWREHERRAYDWRHRHPVPMPGVVYAPPAVVYPPPPEPFGLNLIIPLDIR